MRQFGIKLIAQLWRRGCESVTVGTDLPSFSLIVYKLRVSISDCHLFAMQAQVSAPKWHDGSDTLHSREDRRNRVMHIKLLFLTVAVACAQSAVAQDRIYRCGNEYTNDVAKARQKGCAQIEGANVTIVQGTRPHSGGGAASPAPAPSGGSVAAAPRPARTPVAAVPAPRSTTAEGRARDSDARLILETELKKAESRKSALATEYNNGEPQKNALEMRNPAFYTKRVEDLKTEMARMDSDIAGIQRELQRLPAP